ncbi:MAG: hypothetical protein AAGC63_11550 [Propionicimonas sp.]
MSHPLVDHEDLHWILWDRADSDQRVTVVQRDLASELAIEPQRVSQTLQAMVRKGMLEKISTRRQPAPITYWVADPRS